MIKIENVEVVGWEHALRGMRNPKNSWGKSDTNRCAYLPSCEKCRYNANNGLTCLYPNTNTGGPMYFIGPNDHKLATALAKGGPVHAKYRRMIVVYLDITAPLYWWKEFDTYKVGTVANSCSTMHKIHSKEFTIEDFSCEHLIAFNDPVEFDSVPRVNLSHVCDDGGLLSPRGYMLYLVYLLNDCRKRFLETKDKRYWWQMIQLLPSSYNQKRTVMLNYEVLAGIYPMRKDHKLDEWVEFCKWIETLPYSELIIGGRYESSRV